MSFFNFWGLFDNQEPQKEPRSLMFTELESVLKRRNNIDDFVILESNTPQKMLIQEVASFPKSKLKKASEKKETNQDELKDALEKAILKYRQRMNLDED